jgi:hypothetical protein
MKHEDYRKLMRTPFEELSAEDQEKRTNEFLRRMELASAFLLQLKNGAVSDEFPGDLIEDDDPMKEMIEIIRIKVNDTIGAEA